MGFRKNQFIVNSFLALLFQVGSIYKLYTYNAHHNALLSILYSTCITLLFIFIPALSCNWCIFQPHTRTTADPF